MSDYVSGTNSGKIPVSEPRKRGTQSRSEKRSRDLERNSRVIYPGTGLMSGGIQTMAAGLPKAIMFTIDVLNYRLTLCISGARARVRVLLYSVRNAGAAGASVSISLRYAGFFVFVALIFLAIVILPVFASTLSTSKLQDNLSAEGVTLVNFPNPFDSRKGATKIFILTDYPKGSYFRVKIFDVFGYPVKDCGYVEGGSSIVWDGRDESGRCVAKGGYLVVVFSDDGRISGVKKIGVVH